MGMLIFIQKLVVSVKDFSLIIEIQSVDRRVYRLGIRIFFRIFRSIIVFSKLRQSWKLIIFTCVRSVIFFEFSTNWRWRKAILWKVYFFLSMIFILQFVIFCYFFVFFFLQYLQLYFERYIFFFFFVVLFCFYNCFFQFLLFIIFIEV